MNNEKRIVQRNYIEIRHYEEEPGKPLECSIHQVDDVVTKQRIEEVLSGETSSQRYRWDVETREDSPFLSKGEKTLWHDPDGEWVRLEHTLQHLRTALLTPKPRPWKV
jgi:hypothetical protein